MICLIYLNSFLKQLIRNYYNLTNKLCVTHKEYNNFQFQVLIYYPKLSLL